MGRMQEWEGLVRRVSRLTKRSVPHLVQGGKYGEDSDIGRVAAMGFKAYQKISTTPCTGRYM